MAHQQTETANGPISTKSQATQTLLVQTQIPTQVVSHEVHQFTQLINHDSLEHVGADTLANDSDPEGSGNTVVLHDDDDDDAYGDAESDPSMRGKAEPSLQGQRDSILPGKFESAQGHDPAPSKLVNDFISPHIHRDLPDSDATTEEEGNIENIGKLEADAESQPLLFNANIGNKGAEISESVQPGEVNAQDNLASQETPEAALVAGMTGKKLSQSRRPSIASVRAESLRASGLRAAIRGASIGSDGNDDGNLDLVVDGMLNGELKKPLEAQEAEPENVCAKKAADFDSVQLSPNAMLPFDGMMARSPCMSTSRSKSKGVSLGCASQHALEQEHMHFDGTIELNTNMADSLSHFGKAIEEPKTCTDHPKNMSAPVESLSVGLKRLRSEASVVSAMKLEQHDVANDAMLGIHVKVQKRQPSSQKARKLVFDVIDASPMISTDRLEDGGQNVDPKALGTEHNYGVKKPCRLIDAPTRERKLSLPSGFRAASTNLSYIESQEPGEESQANALNVVDKLVWLDAMCTSDDVVTSPVPQDSLIKGHAGSKGRQSLAQAAQMKIVHDKLDVFDWEDSQVDEDVSPDTQQTANTKARKRHLEAVESMTDRRKRAAPHQQETEAILRMDKTNDSLRQENRAAANVGKSEVSNVEPSSHQELKPHTLLTTRLRNRIKAESGQLAKGRKIFDSKSDPMKHIHKEKQIYESVKEVESGQDKAGDDQVWQADLSKKGKLRNRAGKNTLLDKSGKEHELEQQNRKGRKVEQADSLSAKDKGEPLKTFEVGPQIQGLLGSRRGRKVEQADGLSAKDKGEPLKTSEVGPEIQGHLALAGCTSQDDKAADIWIEAFSNSKNKIPLGSSVELIKFRKRSALHHEHTRQDSKKCRTVEQATASCNEEHHFLAEKEESPKKENRIKPQLSIQQAPNKDTKATAIPQKRGRRVGARYSQEENQDIEKKADKMKEPLIFKTKQRSKSPRIVDALILSQVKGRRVGTRSSQKDYEGASNPDAKPIEEDKAEKGSNTRQGLKQCKTADESMTLPVRSRGISTCGSGGEHTEAEIAREDDVLEGGLKTRSRAQNFKSVVPVSDVKEGIRTKNVTTKSSITKVTANNTDEPLLSRGAMEADFDTKKPRIRTNSSKKESSLSQQHLRAYSTPDAQRIEANLCKVGSSGLASGSLAIDGSTGALAGVSKKSKRRGESFDVIIPESAKDPGSWPKERDKDKSLPKTNDSGCKIGDASNTILLRRTRSSSCDVRSHKNDSANAGKDTIQIQGGSSTDKQSLQKCTDSHDVQKGVKKQAAKSATKTIVKSIIQRNKKRHALEMLNSSILVNEGRRRKRESGCVHVLFSHSLTEETIKHQKKILAKLGGQLAISASDCTHFVSNGFLRSQNMLISMAAGKEIVTTLWLESCGQAHYFVDEKTYIPQDIKKEKELGFSMITSLASARRKPLLKGVNVLVCPNTVPEPAVLKEFVESAGGQVVDIKLQSSYLVEKERETVFLIIANEKDFDFCVQFLDKGLKVYSEELLLHGIVTQTLDYSRNRLFENFKQKKGPR